MRRRRRRVGRRAVEECVKYAKGRERFGQPSWQHQAIGHKIADMAINVEAARVLTYQAAWLVDKQHRNLKAVAFAEAFAADAAMKSPWMRCRSSAATATCRNTRSEKLMRDVKVFQIYEGTSEIQRNVIVRELFR
ncbi:MAG: hypothetical protein IPK17_38315 [Chloroflexi bacterium]|uniref:acyl-CoA dehydrogenase family protein n=1 Tax=Candidatus Flexifilum breve TaxID=3140694 RepID=UPI003134B12E|nr:hypothetical protein [Chloroflexota bacterium]